MPPVLKSSYKCIVHVTSPMLTMTAPACSKMSKVSYTNMQAHLAASIAIISILVNLLLIVGLTVNMDKSITFIIFILISKTTVIIFLNSEILATTISRRWIFSYYSCLISFIRTCGFLLNGSLSVF